MVNVDFCRTKIIYGRFVCHAQSLYYPSPKLVASSLFPFSCWVIFWVTWLTPSLTMDHQFQCNQCDQVFSKMWNLMTHKRRQHLIVGFSPLFWFSGWHDSHPPSPGPMVHRLPTLVNLAPHCFVAHIYHTVVGVIKYFLTTLHCDRCDQVFSTFVNLKKHRRRQMRWISTQNASSEVQICSSLCLRVM